METIVISSLFTVKMNVQRARFQKIGTTWQIVDRGMPALRQTGWLGAQFHHPPEEEPGQNKNKKGVSIVLSEGLPMSYKSRNVMKWCHAWSVKRLGRL